ncbi:MerR family transcriptional regulator [Streptomyces sp. VRA16 Mangrove soil]|uniref:MerR family transcriptional regulator n=1 Tax=Streptomyces sp. VRA16 Mangrove soil TaxID=2817434 RepID=UPI001A9F242C|nr:MerR family transcriptional regulator [Streptomyces sp. VRA16 Mangrove soil]MBO1330616.1 MerR family transcriptional regulator [Streptomyces sp. VRA16 Mangrove soil]
MDEGRAAPQAQPVAVQEAEEGPGVTTGALARRLGVSPTTLRSWDRRYGLGPVHRSTGRHRRWTDEDIAVVEEMCRLTTTGLPPAEAARLARKRLVVVEPVGVPRQTGRRAAPVSPAALEREYRGISRAATRLDAPTVHTLLSEAVTRYGLVAAWQEVMVPVLHAVGRKWEEAGDRYVEVEHLLSWHVSRTLQRAVAAVEPPADVPPLVLACVPAEQHVLPLEALSAGLDELGVPQRMFGAAVPVEAVSAAVRRTGPRIVVLWAQARSTASLPLARHLAETHWGVRGARGKPAVMLAGPGWAGRTVRGALHPATLPQALGQIARLYPEVSRDPAHA